MKKVPAFFFFLAIWLAILISMLQPLSLENPPSPFVFKNYSDNFWVGKMYVNWFGQEKGNLTISRRYGVFSECKTACEKSTRCVAFFIEQVRSGSSTENCYLWDHSAVLPSFSDFGLVEQCSQTCVTYVKGQSDPLAAFSASSHYEAAWSSPLTPGNQGCTQPLFYGVHLCIIVATVICVVYWLFFTLSVPAGRLLRLLFFCCMVGAVVCGAFIASWVSNEKCCPNNGYSSSYGYQSYGMSVDFCTAAQDLLRSTATGAAICLILLGVWPVLLLPWLFVSFIVLGILVGLFALIMQVGFRKIWCYFAGAQWLFWQEHEKKQSLSGKVISSTNFILHDNNNQDEKTNSALDKGPPNTIQFDMLTNMGGESEQAKLIVSLQLQNEDLSRQLYNKGFLDAQASQKALLAEQATTASLQSEVFRLRQELAVLSLKPSASVVNSSEMPFGDSLGIVSSPFASVDSLSPLPSNPPAYSESSTYGTSSSGAGSSSKSTSY